MIFIASFLYFEEQDVFGMISKTKLKAQRNRDYEEHKNYQTKTPIPYIHMAGG